MRRSGVGKRTRKRDAPATVDGARATQDGFRTVTALPDRDSRAIGREAEAAPWYGPPMRRSPCRLAPLLIAAAVLAAPARAADRPVPAPGQGVTVAVPPPPLPVAGPVVAPVVALPFRDPRTGRCLAGFVLNMAGACVRPDDPVIVCTAPPEIARPGLCGVAPPDPAPYGIGANLRLNY